jgi:lipopolysaccharide heptosyltransferase II
VTRSDVSVPSPASPERLVVLAPNWLGDAVMALPAVAAIREWFPSACVAVAARRSVAPLFTLVPGVDEVVALESGGGVAAFRFHRADVARLAAGGFETAVLLPNSFHTALLARQAGIPARWGVRRDLRGALLTTGVRRPRGPMHQAEYYRALVRALGGPETPLVARLAVPADATDRARALLRETGWRDEPLVGFAPGAAFGPAKRWPPERVGAVAAALAREHGVRPLFIGTKTDRAAVLAALTVFGHDVPGGRAIDLTGRTDLVTVTAVLGQCRALVSNDSGAMHLATAVGTPVVAIFGPTDERATSPLPNPEGPGATPVVGEAFCRPCLLRACPLDHRCMLSVSTARVAAAVSAALAPGSLEGLVG